MKAEKVIRKVMAMDIALFRAASSGDAHPQFDLGLCHANGDGVS